MALGAQTELETFGGNARQKLLSLINRVETLNADRAAIAEDIKEVYAEARGDGFSPKIMRQVVARRAKDAAKLAEEQALFDIYMTAIGEGGRD